MSKKKKSKKKDASRATDISKSMDEMGKLGGEGYFKPKEGKNVVRILPPWNDEGVFFKKGIIHYNVGDNIVTCKQMAGKTCPICDALKDLGTDIAKEAAPKTKFYVNVIDRSNEAAGPQILALTPKQMKSLRKYLEDPDYGDFTDPDEGRDIIIEKDSSGNMTQYDLRLRPKETEVGVEDWEDNLRDLDTEAVSAVPSNKEYHQLVNDFLGGEGEVEEEEEEGEDSDDNDDDNNEAETLPAKDCEKGEAYVIEDEDGDEVEVTCTKVTKKKVVFEDEDGEEYTLKPKVEVKAGETSGDGDAGEGEETTAGDCVKGEKYIIEDEDEDEVEVECTKKSSKRVVFEDEDGEEYKLKPGDSVKSLESSDGEEEEDEDDEEEEKPKKGKKGKKGKK